MARNLQARILGLTISKRHEEDKGKEESGHSRQKCPLDQNLEVEQTDPHLSQDGKDSNYTNKGSHSLRGKADDLPR